MRKHLRRLLLLWVFLAACRPTEPALEAVVTAVSTPIPTQEIRIVTEFSYAIEPRDEMIKTADAIFAGRVTDISPTQWNQDSGEYWETTTEEGSGLETTHAALPVFTVELTVDEVLIDEVGLGETAVLTQVGGSPLDDNDDWSLQVGDEIIAFVVQREIAWWDGQPVRAIPHEDGFSFEVGCRDVLRFSNAPADTYLLRRSDGRYASLPAAYDPWPPMTLAEFIHEIAFFRPVLTDGGVTLQITTPEPSPTPAVCTPLPEGMTFTVTPVSDTAVALELTGLQPGEQPYFIFTQKKPDGMYQMEEYDIPPVGEEGLFAYTTRLSSPYESLDWEIKVLHAQGVTCLEITLPLEGTAVPLPSAMTPPQINCPDPQVGALVPNNDHFIYTNPVLGVELTTIGQPCVGEPDYLFDSYGFTLADPESGEASLLRVDWLNQARPEQLDTYVQQAIDSFPQLEIHREAVAIDGMTGVMLWPLPGTEATTQIYLVANDRLYQLIFWSAPLDEQAQTLLDSLRFVEPTQSLDSLNLPRES